MMKRGGFGAREAFLKVWPALRSRCMGCGSAPLSTTHFVYYTVVTKWELHTHALLDIVSVKMLSLLHHIKNTYLESLSRAGEASTT